MYKTAGAIVADEKGRIFELEGYSAAGMAGEDLFVLDEENTAPMPSGSELMFLPQRHPILLNNITGAFEEVEYNPYGKGHKIFAVSAFNSPGYVITLNSAFSARHGVKPLPLFSYGAVGSIGDQFVSSVFQVDKEKRQDLSLMPIEKVQEGVADKTRLYPKNRLIYHLKKCALEWGCPAAKNFFLQRFEAPLPTSRNCNASCLGCISFQKENRISSCQNRITFTPSPEEIAEVALLHIDKVEKAVVSFGQGCEGDPLLAWKVILPAIELIRKKTSKGTINMNTNASMPDILEKLFNAGLNSIRVSMNSARKKCYLKYFRPKYKFEDILKSIKTAESNNIHVAINYLNLPGFTDTEPEVAALQNILDNYKIDLIQWRNLNYDPKLYMQQMLKRGEYYSSLGIKELIGALKENYPELKHGYFNPPKENFTKS